MRDHAPLIEALQAENAALRQRLADLEQTEAALQSSQTNLTALIENTDARIWAVDTQYRLIAGNSFFQKFIQQALGQPIAIGDSVLNDRFPPEVRTEWRGYYDRALHGETFSVEIQTRFATPPRTVEYRFNPIQTPAGQVTGATVFERNITERKQMEAALRDTRENFRQFIEQSSESFMLLDEQGTIVEWNRAAEHNLGLKREQVIGRPYWMMHDDIAAVPLQPDQLAARRALILEALRTGQSSLFDQPLVSSLVLPTGERRSFEQVIFPIKTAKGFRVGAVVHNITAHQQLEEALRASEAQLRALIDYSPAAIIQFAPNGNIVLWNAAAERIFGWTAAEVLGKTLPTVPADKLTERLAFQARVNQGEVVAYAEVQRQRKDGTLIDVGLSVAPLRDATGQIYAQMSISTDITERKHIEAALRASEEKFRAIIEQSSEGILLIDEQGLIMELNRAYEQITGLARAEVVGQPAWEIQLRQVSAARRAQITLEHLKHNLLQTLATGQSRQFTRPVEIPIATTAGETKFIIQNAFPIQTDHGYRLGIIIHDITDRKRMEEALRDLNITLEQRVADRTAELQAANVRLTELDHLKDEFLSRISHELRTPLTGILISLELLETARPEKRERYLQRLKQSTERMRDMIEDVLMFSQLNRYTQPALLTPVNLNNLIEGQATAWRLLSVTRNLALQLDLANDLPRARVDGELIAQAITRLITNAVNYTPAGSVTITTAPRSEGDQTWVTISVTDTGPGIAPEDLPHIFERFYRGRAAADYKTPGTGVGLSISREIVERMGGHLTVETQVGVGSTFTIWLPAA